MKCDLTQLVVTGRPNKTTANIARRIFTSLHTIYRNWTLCQFPPSRVNLLRFQIRNVKLKPCYPLYLRWSFYATFNESLMLCMQKNFFNGIHTGKFRYTCKYLLYSTCMPFDGLLSKTNNILFSFHFESITTLRKIIIPKIRACIILYYSMIRICLLGSNKIDILYSWGACLFILEVKLLILWITIKIL